MKKEINEVKKKWRDISDVSSEKYKSPEARVVEWSNKTLGEKKEEWEDEHQPFELSYHQHGNLRWPGMYDGEWEKMWMNVFSSFMELSPDGFSDSDVLLDLGCGSRPSLDWFSHGKRYHLDPLLNDYLNIPQTKHFWESESNLYSQAAEDLVEDLVGKCDYVHCWNVLDHTYNWREILENMAHYSKKGGLALLGTDAGRPHIGHTGIDNQRDLYEIIERNFNIVKRLSPGQPGSFKFCRQIMLKLEKR